MIDANNLFTTNKTAHKMKYQEMPHPISQKNEKGQNLKMPPEKSPY